MEEFQTKQVSQEDIKKIKDISYKYQSLTIEVGQKEIERRHLQQELEKITNSINELWNQYKENAIQEQTLAKYLSNTYGDGELDLDTGIMKIFNK